LLTAIGTEYVEYYRCDSCGHVWVRDKNDPDEKPKSITYIPKK